MELARVGDQRTLEALSSPLLEIQNPLEQIVTGERASTRLDDVILFEELNPSGGILP